MSRKFTKLITLTIKHDYYSAGLSSDFDFVATPECKKVVDRYRLKLIPDGAQIHVFYEQRLDEGVWVAKFPIEQDVEFTFLMRLKNPYLKTFSDQNQIQSLPRDQMYLFENTTSPGLAQSAISFRAMTFDYIPTVDSTNWNFDLIPEGGGASIYTVAGIEGKAGIRVDLTNLEESVAPGWYDLKETDVANSNAMTSQLVYLGSGIPASAYFGMIRLKEVAAFDNTENVDGSPIVEYEIQFNARTEPWVYNIDFTRVPPTDIDDVYMVDKASGGLSNIKLVITTNSDGRLIGSFATPNLSYGELPRAKLSIQEAPAGGKIYIKNLPNPSIMEPEPMILISL